MLLKQTVPTLPQSDAQTVVREQARESNQLPGSTDRDEADVEDLRTHLEHGLDPNLRNPSQSTILHECAKKGTKVAAREAKLLIRAGADVNAQDWQGKTPLHIAILQPYLDKKSPNYELVATLLAAKARIDIEDQFGDNPARCAWSTKDEKMIKLFEGLPGFAESKPQAAQLRSGEENVIYEIPRPPK